MAVNAYRMRGGQRPLDSGDAVEVVPLTDDVAYALQVVVVAQIFEDVGFCSFTVKLQQVQLRRIVL